MAFSILRIIANVADLGIDGCDVGNLVHRFNYVVNVETVLLIVTSENYVGAIYLLAYE